MRVFVFIFLFFFVPFRVHSATITLRSGKIIEAEIIERTGSYLRVDVSGIPITYYLDQIERIEENGAAEVVEAVDAARLRQVLKELGYPEEHWPVLERKFRLLAREIDFPRLRREAKGSKYNPDRLKKFIAGLGAMLQQYGYLEVDSPHPLMKVLVNSLGERDIYTLVETSELDSRARELDKELYFGCTASTQLGVILFALLDLDAKVASSQSYTSTQSHFFNYVPFPGREVLFVDFLSGVYELVPMEGYYRRAGDRWVLKEKYRLPPEFIRRLIARRTHSPEPNTPKELLNIFYLSVHLSEATSATAGIILNYGSAYLLRGELDEAIEEYTRALELNSSLGDGYYNRGNAYYKNDQYHLAVKDFTRAVELNPRDASAYYNRAVAYYSLGNYAQAREDIGKVKELGGKTDPEFLKNLEKAQDT
ncbi:MAG: tetratricopeptide repeat protein [Candidatus Omnitrophica bacterium]|nr:tetratricopeptide repeat protein [Candidatus Omnitrophota bacterium]